MGELYTIENALWLNFSHSITFHVNLFETLIFLLFYFLQCLKNFFQIYFLPLCCCGAVYWEIFLFFLRLFLLIFLGSRKIHTAHIHRENYIFFPFLRLSFEFSSLFFANILVELFLFIYRFFFLCSSLLLPLIDIFFIYFSL